MKAQDIEELKKYVSKRDLATMFHIYPDSDLNVKNAEVYNIMRTLYVLNLKDIPKSYFKYYQVGKKDTWNLIAYKLYGSVELWWLLLKLNEIKDPTFEPEQDSYVRYISKENANRIIDTLKTQ